MRGRPTLGEKEPTLGRLRLRQPRPLPPGTRHAGAGEKHPPEKETNRAGALPPLFTHTHRYYVTKTGRVIMGSEVGVVDIPPQVRLAKTTTQNLHPRLLFGCRLLFHPLAALPAGMCSSAPGRSPHDPQTCTSLLAAGSPRSRPAGPLLRLLPCRPHPPPPTAQDVERKGRLMPGNILLVDFDAHELVDDEAVRGRAGWGRRARLDSIIEYACGMVVASAAAASATTLRRSRPFTSTHTHPHKRTCTHARLPRR